MDEESKRPQTKMVSVVTFVMVIIIGQLTDEKARDIIMMKGKESIADAANRYNVCHATIRAIYNGKTWKHLK